MDLLSAYGPAATEYIRLSVNMAVFSAGGYALQRLFDHWALFRWLFLGSTVAWGVVLASWLLSVVWWAAPLIPVALAVVALLVYLEGLPMDNRVQEDRR